MEIGKGGSRTVCMLDIAPNECLSETYFLGAGELPVVLNPHSHDVNDGNKLVLDRYSHSQVSRSYEKMQMLKLLQLNFIDNKILFIKRL